MVSACSLSCSVCNTCFKTRSEWLSHLLRSQHQSLARNECLSWSKRMKSCVLVAFASFPVACENVLKSFSQVGRETIITDFVWSENRPKVALIQFESRAKVKEILERLGRPEMTIDGDRDRFLQLKKASDFLKLEWDGLMEVFKDKEAVVESIEDNSTQVKSEPVSESSDDDDDESVDVKPDIGGDDEEGDQDFIIPPDFVVDRVPIKIERGYEAPQQSSSFINNNPPPPIIRASVPVAEAAPGELRQQFDGILKEVSIPSEEFNQALEVMEKCRQIFASKFPSCKLYMFRHWYLKLKSFGVKELLFYVDFEGTLDGSHLQEIFREKPLILTLPEIEELFTSPPALKILPGVSSVPKPNQEERFEPRAFQFQLQHQSSTLKFSIVADSLFKTEVQTCRLVNYLLDSDPRARPFLTLIWFWAKKGHTKFSMPFCKFRHKSHAFAPEPSALVWMIILFLTHKKIISSPREVLQRTHQKLVVFGKVDIGFSTNKWTSIYSSSSKIPSENSDEFFIHLIQLAEEFFTFYLQLREGTWILNTRDGELIKKEDFFEKRPYVDWKTKLKPEEIASIKQVGADYSRTMVNLNTKVIILHPLFIEWVILFSYEGFVKSTDFKMMSTAAIIKRKIKDSMGGRGGEYSLAYLFRSNSAKRVRKVADELPFIPEPVKKRLEKLAKKKGKKIRKSTRMKIKKEMKQHSQN